MMMLCAPSSQAVEKEAWETGRDPTVKSVVGAEEQRKEREVGKVGEQPILQRQIAGMVVVEVEVEEGLW
jgi:hypothetical protein